MNTHWRTKVAAMKAMILLVTVLLVGCGTASKTAVALDQMPDLIRVACVGDDITYGEGVRYREENSYPIVLGKLLGTRFQTVNFGVPGATLLRQGDRPYKEQPEFKQLAAFRPHIVLMMLGTNDTMNQNWPHKDQLASDLNDLLDHIEAFPSQPEIRLCLPVPFYGDLRAVNGERLDQQVIPVLRSVAAERGHPVIDVNAGMKRREQQFADSIHPNDIGSAMMAQIILYDLIAEPGTQ